MGTRLDAILLAQGYACYCPDCGDLLNDQAVWECSADDKGGWFVCSACGCRSQWRYTPAPGLELVRSPQ